MATSEFSPMVRTGLARPGASQHFQPIDAHYYNITDIQAWPIAGLLVLLDCRGQPVRAELHLYDDLPSHVQEAAVRQSRLVLQEHYVGGEPVPLRILETQQLREAMDVRLPPPSERSLEPVTVRWQPYALGGLVMVAIAGLIWLALAFSRPDGGEVARDWRLAGAGDLAGEGAATGDLAVDEASGAAPPAAENAPALSGADLPPSRNARADLRIGMRVAIVPGLQLALRSEPGADAGVVVGAMSDGQEARIIDGPYMTQGESDTIVWWQVELDDGTRAWAAANTSQQTLLIPAEQ